MENTNHPRRGDVFEAMFCKLICEMVEKEILRQPEEPEFHVDRGLLLQMEIYDESRRKPSDDPEWIPTSLLNVLFHAPGNYVGVYTHVCEIGFSGRRSFRIDSRNPWKVWAYHDSCWRIDGLQRIIREFPIRGLATYNCTRVIGITPEMQEKLIEVRQQREENRGQ